MPERLVAQFVEDIPRLEAQETLRIYHAMVLASGNLKRHDLSAALRELQAQARGQTTPSGGRAVYRPKTREEFEALMRQAGMVHG